jgi:uncharacterized protein
MMTPEPAQAAPIIPAGPVTQMERIPSLDVMRGFALLGILIMNIQGFSMIYAAYFNPAAYGDLGGVHRWVWILSHLLSDQKFMAIFSMLFGAGIVLMALRAEARGRRPAGLHYRRMLILIVLGAMHAYLLWYGDILVIYGMSGLVVYLFWRRSWKTLLVLGVLMLAVSSAFSLLAGVSLPAWPEVAREGFIQTWDPPPESVQAEVAIYRGGWVGQFEHRIPKSLEFHTTVFLFWGFWRSGGLMLIGMALYKMGFFRLRRPLRFSFWSITLAVLVGLPLVGYGIYRNFASGWDVTYTFFLGGQYNYWGSIIVSFGWLGVVYWLGTATSWAGVTRPLAAVGQTAFSNYILQTLICTTIFYGHGFGYYGHVDRLGQILIVFGVWTVQLALSTWWMRRFRFGPLEWLWRSLTYCKLQPFRIDR